MTRGHFDGRKFDYVVIEYPSMGGQYCREQYGVYGYDEYPRGSVLEGQTRRSFLNAFDTLEEAQATYPEAEWNDNGSGYQEPYLDHLPDGPDL